MTATSSNGHGSSILTPRLSIAMVSAGALAYEVLLIRLFSIIQWHHFAYMIISLALLGYGASGTFLSLARERLRSHFSSAYIVSLLLFAVSATGCFLIAQQLPFSPHELLWDARQPFWLLMMYLLLALPFFFAANCIGLALSHLSFDVSRIYAADLLGAAAGSIAIIGLLFLAFPAQVLLLLGSFIAMAAWVAAWELGLRSRALLGLTSFLLIGPWLLPSQWTALNISPYKGVEQLLQISGTEVVEERSSPLGLLTLVQSPKIPLRYAPGLSLQAIQTPPEQLALFTDGNGMSAITRYDGDNSQLSYLDYLTSALPYHLGKPEQVLILGAGGGSEILQARYHGAVHIDAVELNPQIVDLLRNEYADYSGNVFNRPDTQIHIAEARGYVAGTDRDYDLIQMSLLDSFSASSAGLYALSESYLYSVEAFEEYLRHLKPGGYLAISRWVRLPPRDTLKLFATAIDALRAMGIDNPQQRLVLIRSWQISTLVIKNGVITQEEIANLHRFTRQRAFDLVYYPNIREQEANRYNLLRQDYFYQGAQALLGGQRASYLNEYKFRLEPATDDRPYFFNFFKWRVLPEIFSLRGQGGLPLLGMGYLILIATFLQALVGSFFLIILPLLLGRSPAQNESNRILRIRSLIYFFSLGLAFLFIEIAFIQKFILFLHHPLYAVSVVLAAFLLFAGLGSAFSGRYADKARSAIRSAIMGIVVLGLGSLMLFEPLMSEWIGLSGAERVLITIAWIGPLAFCMGMPFPMGLTRLSRTVPDMIPWVWGVNGCASVISAILATMLAIHFGFSVVIVTALGFYIIAAVLAP